MILYLTSISKVYQNQDKVIEKIKSALSIFKENKEDIALLWYPMPIPEDAVEAFDEEILSKYEEIIRNYKNEGWGILVDDTDLEKVIKVVDAFYGDADAVTLKIRDLKKPGMLQNYDII